MSHQGRLGHDGTEPTGSSKPDDDDDYMQKKVCEFEFALGHSQPFIASKHIRIVSKVAEKAIVQLCIAYIRSDGHTGYS